eukprot:gene47242-41938_t
MCGADTTADLGPKGESSRPLLPAAVHLPCGLSAWTCGASLLTRYENVRRRAPDGDDAAAGDGADGADAGGVAQEPSPLRGRPCTVHDTVSWLPPPPHLMSGGVFAFAPGQRSGLAGCFVYSRRVDEHLKGKGWIEQAAVLKACRAVRNQKAHDAGHGVTEIAELRTQEGTPQGSRASDLSSFEIERAVLQPLTPARMRCLAGGKVQLREAAAGDESPRSARCLERPLTVGLTGTVVSADGGRVVVRGPKGAVSTYAADELDAVETIAVCAGTLQRAFDAKTAFAAAPTVEQVAHGCALQVLLWRGWQFLLAFSGPGRKLISDAGGQARAADAGDGDTAPLWRVTCPVGEQVNGQMRRAQDGDDETKVVNMEGLFLVRDGAPRVVATWCATGWVVSAPGAQPETPEQRWCSVRVGASWMMPQLADYVWADSVVRAWQVHLDVALAVLSLPSVLGVLPIAAAPHRRWWLDSALSLLPAQARGRKNYRVLSGKGLPLSTYHTGAVRSAIRSFGQNGCRALSPTDEQGVAGACDSRSPAASLVLFGATCREVSRWCRFSRELEMLTPCSTAAAAVVFGCEAAVRGGGAAARDLSLAHDGDGARPPRWQHRALGGGCWRELPVAAHAAAWRCRERLRAAEDAVRGGAGDRWQDAEVAGAAPPAFRVLTTTAGTADDGEQTPMSTSVCGSTSGASSAPDRPPTVQLLGAAAAGMARYISGGGGGEVEADAGVVDALVEAAAADTAAAGAFADAEVLEVACDPDDAAALLLLPAAPDEGEAWLHPVDHGDGFGGQAVRA